MQKRIGAADLYAAKGMVWYYRIVDSGVAGASPHKACALYRRLDSRIVFPVWIGKCKDRAVEFLFQVCS